MPRICMQSPTWRIPPLERHQKGVAVKLGATPDHCHLFDSDGQAFQRKIVEVLAA
jgi:multiple sugar transport system ATP-binding protein